MTKSAPSIDPRWSAHAQVRALSESGVMRQVASHVWRSGSQLVSESKSRLPSFIPSTCDDYSTDSTKYSSDEEGKIFHLFYFTIDFKSKLSSLQGVQLCKTP